MKELSLLPASDGGGWMRMGGKYCPRAPEHALLEAAWVGGSRSARAELGSCWEGRDNRHEQTAGNLSRDRKMTTRAL